MKNTRQLHLPLALAIAGSALLAAGCGAGGAGKSSSTAAGGASQKTFAAAAYKYSACMRRHGVPAFPDPVVVSSPGHQSVGLKVTPAETGSPAFATAQNACQGILPGAGNGNAGRSPAQIAARVKGFVSFANCMRSHQVPTFPDPNAQGQLRPEMLSAAGINLHAPAVKAAAIACVPSSQGQLTKAQVESALNNGGG